MKNGQRKTTIAVSCSSGQDGSHAKATNLISCRAAKPITLFPISETMRWLSELSTPARAIKRNKFVHFSNQSILPQKSLTSTRSPFQVCAIYWAALTVMTISATMTRCWKNLSLTESTVATCAVSNTVKTFWMRSLVKRNCLLKPTSF